jgi:Flp pilus assembly protein TadG
MKNMRGLASVEFAIVASVLMTVIFGCLEFGRAMYTYAALNEGTRRAARLAAVCPIGDAKISAAVNFLGAPGFNDNNNVSVTYLDANGDSLGGAPAIANVYYVQVSVVGYHVPLAIPFVGGRLTPSFSVTLPAESLGWSGAGVSTAC